MTVRPGDTFFVLADQKPHLWVILWGPAGPADAYLAVCFNTVRGHTDRTCLIGEGEHPFVRHETAVGYGSTMRWPHARLVQLVENGIAKPRQPVDGSLLARIRAGFFSSARTPNAFLDMAVNDFGAERPG
jgi:hypothetical protein